MAIVALVTCVVINPVARVRFGAIRATCGGGARPSWIWIGALASISIRAEAKAADAKAIVHLHHPLLKHMRQQQVSPRFKKDTA